MARLSAIGLLAVACPSRAGRRRRDAGDVLRAEGTPGSRHELPAVPRGEEDQQRPEGRLARCRSCAVATGGRRSCRASPRKSLLDPGCSAHRRRPEDAAGRTPCRRSRSRRSTDWVSRRGSVAQGDDRKAPGRRSVAARTGRFRKSNASSRRRDPSGWSSTPIDRFVAARRRAAGLSPVRPADRRTLIRRVTFDLIGLPPTPERDRRFPRRSIAGRLRSGRRSFARLAALRRALGAALDGRRALCRHGRRQRRLPDPGSGALSRLHHRLVQRRQALRPDGPRAPGRRHSRAPRRRRSDYAESVIATGFLALSRRYATAPFELWHLTLEDTIDTTGRAFLGLTLRCARCHDHKFDPVSQRDYYALYGIFASTTFPYAGSEELQSKSFPRMNFVPVWRRLGCRSPSSSDTRSGWPSSIARRRRSKPKSDPGIEEQRLSKLRADGRSCAGRRCRQTFRAAMPSARESRSTCRFKGGATRTPGRGRAARRAAIRVPGRRAPPGRRARRKRPARAGRLAGAAGSSADSPRDGEPDLAVPFRPGDRGDPVQLRRSRRAAQLIPSCSTGSPRNSSRTAGRSRSCTGKSCFPRPTSSRAKPIRERSSRPGRPLALAVSSGAAGRRVDPRRDAGRLGKARATPGRAASVSGDRSLALDPAQPVQGGLSHAAPQRLPDDPAAGEAPVPGDLRRARTPTRRPTSGRVRPFRFKLSTFATTRSCRNRPPVWPIACSQALGDDQSKDRCTPASWRGGARRAGRGRAVHVLSCGLQEALGAAQAPRPAIASG